MARRANPTLIGTFVLAAIALGVLLVVLLGSWTFFTQPRHFVVVFKTSLHGLSVGPDGKAVLVARWYVLGGDEGKVLHSGSNVITQPSPTDDYAGIRRHESRRGPTRP